MEILLKRINNEINDALEKQVTGATLQLMFLPKDSINFDALVGIYLNENEPSYHSDVRAMFEFARHFSLNVLFLKLNFDTHKVECLHTLDQLFDKPLGNWADTQAKIRAFVTAKMQSIKNAEVDKFNEEWHNCF